jgi:hypothetical protein
MEIEKESHGDPVAAVMLILLGTLQGLFYGWLIWG